MTMARLPSEEGVIQNVLPHASRPHKAGAWILAATILGSSLYYIDSNAVNVALPVMQRDLHATAAAVQWVYEAFILLLSAFMLVGGVLGDAVGRRRIFASGAVLFTLASIGCGLAPSIGWIIASRVVQGIGGALLVPGSMSIMGASFSDKQRGSAIGTWVAFTTLIEAIAMVLGGWVVQNASWRWVFFINVPVAVLMLLITFRYVPESRDDSASRHLDWPGAVLVTFGLGAVVYGLITAGTAGFGDLVVLLTLGAGLVALLLFLLVEVYSPAPMLPLSLFRSPTFSATNLLTLLLYAGLNGVLYFLSFNLQQVQGYSPLATGAALFPFTVLVFVLSRWTGGLVERYRARPLLIGGSVITGIGFALFAVPTIGGSYWVTYFPAIIIMSLGMAIVVAPLTTAVMSSVEQRHSGIASGVNNAVARAAGLLAIAVLGLLVSVVFNSTLTSHTALLHLSPAVQQALDAQRPRLAAAQAPSTTSPAVHAALQRAIAESFVAGFRVTMLVSAGLALLGALVVALLVPSGHLKQSEDSKKRTDAGYHSTESENEAASQGLPNRTE